MKYEITVTELRKFSTLVEANSAEEAVKAFEAEYWENPAEYDDLLDAYDTTIECTGEHAE